MALHAGCHVFSKKFPSLSSWLTKTSSKLARGSVKSGVQGSCSPQFVELSIDLSGSGAGQLEGSRASTGPSRSWTPTISHVWAWTGSKLSSCLPKWRQEMVAGTLARRSWELPLTDGLDSPKVYWAGKPQPLMGWKAPWPSFTRQS